METNIGDKVLAAFQVEYREGLEQIRELLTQLELDSNTSGDARLQDAFRLAHSLKGGARVCDLRPVEQLSHGLETVLEGLNQGRLRLGKDVVSTITLVMNAIEDWMTALDDETACPDTTNTLSAIEHLLDTAPSAQSSPEPPLQSPPQPSFRSRSDTGLSERSQPTSDLAARLQAAFCTEFSQHLASLRRLQETWREEASDEAASAELARIGHTLAGAARVVDFAAVEKEAKLLEARFRGGVSNGSTGEPVGKLVIEQAIEALENAYREDCEKPLPCVTDVKPHGEPAVCAAGQADSPTSSATSSSLSSAGAFNEAAAASPLHRQQETVRISVESLDRLIHSSGELLAEVQRQEQFSRQLQGLRRDIEDLDRERETIRRLAASSLRGQYDVPELNRITRYLEFVDRQVHRLARQGRQLTLLHRRAAWAQRVRTQQIHRHVREARMVPFDSIFQGLRKMVRDLATEEGKRIEFVSAGFDTRADRRLLQAIRDSIIHMLRNCVTHGIELPELRSQKGKPEAGRVAVEVSTVGNRLRIIVDDDGRGIDVERIVQRAVERGMISPTAASQQSPAELATLVFAPGLSTIDAVTELAGRGMGLSIVQEQVAKMRGEVHWVPKATPGTRFQILLPTSLSSHRLMIVACGAQTFAIPLQGIDRLLYVKKKDVETVEGQNVIMDQGRPIPLMPLATLLGIKGPSGEPEGAIPAVLLKSGKNRLVASVDSFVEERDALVHDLDCFAQTRLVVGAMLLADGSVSLVVNPADLINAYRPSQAASPAASSDPGEADETAKPIEPASPAAAVRVLVVDDSFTTRTLEKNILEAYGYQVQVAVDGAEAWAHLRTEPYDLVIADIEMPRIDGFALLERMKADPRMAQLPVILVTSRDRAADKQRGLDLGADAYIVKRKFDHQDLLAIIKQIL